MAAPTAAPAPHARTNQNTFAWPIILRNTSEGIWTTAQIVSLMKAWWPRPSAKNAYRQLSCSISPGMVRPRARKASPVVPPISLTRRECEGSGDQAHEQRGARATRGGAPPGRRDGAAEPDQERLDRNAPRRVERESIRHIGQAEGAELDRTQRTVRRRCSAESSSGWTWPDPRYPRSGGGSSGAPRAKTVPMGSSEPLRPPVSPLHRSNLSLRWRGTRWHVATKIPLGDPWRRGRDTSEPLAVRRTGRNMRSPGLPANLTCRLAGRPVDGAETTRAPSRSRRGEGEVGRGH